MEIDPPWRPAVATASNHRQEVVTMIGALAAYSYGSGGSGGATWALVVVIAAAVIAAVVWSFLRVRRRRHGPSPQPPGSA